MNGTYYAGLALLSFSSVKFIAFLGSAYPSLRWGCFLILLTILCSFWVTGLLNHQGLRLKGHFNQSGFIPSIALSIPFLVAIAAGVYEAGGQR